MRELEVSVNELRKRRLALEAEIEIASNVSANDRASAENVAQLMEKLSGEKSETDEKDRLRFRLNSEIKKIVEKIVLFPGGGQVMSPQELEKTVIFLRESGYDDERISTYVASLPLKPNRDGRFFIAHLHNGNKRTVIGGIDTMLETMPPAPLKFLDELRVRLEEIRRASDVKNLLL